MDRLKRFRRPRRVELNQAFLQISASCVYKRLEKQKTCVIAKLNGFQEQDRRMIVRSPSKWIEGFRIRLNVAKRISLRRCIAPN